MPKLELEPIADAESTNSEYVQAHLAVAGLTLARHYVLRVADHDHAAKLIENALEGAVHLRDRVKKNPASKQGLRTI